MNLNTKVCMSVQVSDLGCWCSKLSSGLPGIDRTELLNGKIVV